MTDSVAEELIRGSRAERQVQAQLATERSLLLEIANLRHFAQRIEAELEQIIGHLGAAKMQRASSDDQIIAEHIDAALEIATAARRALLAQAA